MLCSMCRGKQVIRQGRHALSAHYCRVSRPSRHQRLAEDVILCKPAAGRLSLLALQQAVS